MLNNGGDPDEQHDEFDVLEQKTGHGSHPSLLLLLFLRKALLP